MRKLVQRAEDAESSDSLEDTRTSGTLEIESDSLELVCDAFIEDGLHPCVRDDVSRVNRVRHPRSRVSEFLAVFDAEKQPARVRAMFHGLTVEPRPETVARVSLEGLDPRKCKAAMFGKGAYVAAAGAKARMYALNAKYDRRHGQCIELHQEPLCILVGLLIAGDYIIGERGEGHSCVTADSINSPTQFCVPVGLEKRMLITHVIGLDVPLPQAPPTPTPTTAAAVSNTQSPQKE